MVVSTSLMTGAMSLSTGGELVDGKGLVGIAFLGDNIQREAFGNFFEHALGLFGLLQQVGNLGKRGDLDPQLLVQQQGQLVDQLRLRGSESAISSVPFCACMGTKL